MGYRRKISIHLMFLLIGITLETTCLSCYFNTSHVSINRKAAEDDLLDIRYFNTSHVSINPGCEKPLTACMIHFNTSHVSINLLYAMGAIASAIFQYISCFY